MLSKEEKLHIISTITTSKTFQKATTSSALLKYLIKAEIEKTFLKEDIIDLEFFGSKGKLDKSNTRVRVSMYNLRKKLENFYTEEGNNQIWKVVIDKGQYGIRFEKEVVETRKVSDFINKHTVIYTLLLSVIITIVVRSLPSPKPLIWDDFLNDDKPATLYIGDAFGMRGQTITGRPGFTRDYSINSVEQFYKLAETKPQLKKQLEPSNYQYFTGMGAIAAKNIAQLFTPYGKRFDIKFNSNASLDDIKNGNAIYAGPVLNENKFIPLFNDANAHMKIGRYTLEIKGISYLNDTILRISTSGKTSDYAIVSKYPGPMGTEQLVFFSNHDMGVSATIEYFTNRDSIKHFANTYLKDHKYFTALFKAHGRERTSLDLDMIWVIPFD